MASILFIVMSLMAALLFQIIIPMYFSFSVIPEIVLITVLFYSFRFGALSGEFYGFLGGILLDTFSVHVFGLRALLFTIIGYSAGMFSKKLDESKPEVQVFVTFISLVLYYAFDNLLIKHAVSGTHVIIVIFNLAINCLIAPFIFMGLNIYTNSIKKWSGKVNQQ